MSRLGLELLVGLVAGMAVAPPGMCPCWLIQHVERYHPHPGGQSGRPHGHAYLLELYQGQTAAAPPTAALPAATFVLLLAFGAVRLGARAEPDAQAHRWSHLPPTPPPRLAA